MDNIISLTNIYSPRTVRENLYRTIEYANHRPIKTTKYHRRLQAARVGGGEPHRMCEEQARVLRVDVAGIGECGHQCETGVDGGLRRGYRRFPHR